MAKIVPPGASLDQKNSVFFNVSQALKDTSLAAAIAVPELTYYARKINVESYRVIETWMVTTALYVAACYLIAMLLRYLEQRLAIRR